MTESHSHSSTKIDWLLIGLLFALVLPLRLWLLHNTEVAARDSITYVQYALQFEEMPWQDVLKKNHQHPGYPVLVWLVSLPVRAIDGSTTPANMALSTQLVSMVASFLLILPMYWLGRQFFDRKVSFWATLLYQYLPISAQHLSDGLSEPMYLVLIVTGLLQGVHAVRERLVWRSVLCGFFAGLAYLTRPEGVLILAACAGVLIALQFRADWRCSWNQFLKCGTAMALTAMLTGSAYVFVTGRLTNKQSPWKVVGQQVRLQEPPSVGSGSGVLFAASFLKSDDRMLRILPSVRALLTELVQSLHYVGIIPALLGLWWSLGRLRLNPGFWVAAGYSVLHSLMLIALAISVGYVSDRHVMILALFGCYFMVVGLRELPCRVLAWCKVAAPQTATWRTCWRSAPAWSAFLLVGLIAFCLPKATQRLHGNRVGNRSAGLWLAQHLQAGDEVIDEYDWSRFFAGIVARKEQEPGHTPTCYFVNTLTRGPQLAYKHQTVEQRPDAKVVYVWPEESDVAKARIVVYAQPRDLQ